MSDWSQGYPTDNAYIDAIQVEVNPCRWRQAMNFAQFQSPDPGRPFRMVDFGCGSATTLIAMAALYPHAEFIGYDFMPEHIVTANRLIDEVGLENVVVREGSFAEMAEAGCDDKIDFAVVHGVWAWVPEEVRGDLVRALNGWMAPGSVTYFGYNAAAGWAAAEPIRQIFRTAPRGRGEHPFEAARKGVDTWLALQGDMFPQARMLWEHLSNSPDHFLAHEIASEHGTGVWLEELAGPLEGAKMGFAGPAVLAEHMDALFLEDDAVAYLRDAVSQGWGETARDLVHRRTFRNDLFHRGAPAMPGSAMVALMRELRMIPWDKDLLMGTHPSVHGQLVREVDERVVAGLQELCAGGDATFGDCMDAIEADPMAAFQAVMMAYVSGALIELRPQSDIAAAQAGCDRFNAAMLRRLESGQVAPGLAAPGYGGCVQLQRSEDREVLLGKAEDTTGLRARMQSLGVTLG